MCEKNCKDMLLRIKLTQMLEKEYKIDIKKLSYPYKGYIWSNVNFQFESILGAWYVGELEEIYGDYII